LLPLTSIQPPEVPLGERLFPSRQINETVRLAKIDREGKEKKKGMRSKSRRNLWKMEWSVMQEEGWNYFSNSTSDDHMNVPQQTLFVELIVILRVTVTTVELRTQCLQ
jgi:hypothetical protein